VGPGLDATMTVAPSRPSPLALPRALRDRLARLILAALHDAGARRILTELAAPPAAVPRWLPPDTSEHAAAVTERARRAAVAVATRPLDRAGGGLADALGDAATLFDAGLYFEVHELLEPLWMTAAGAEREALQGLIQVAVGCQHLANGNRPGAQALLGEGGAKLAGQRLATLDLTGFAEAVGAMVDGIGDDFDWTLVPRFPSARVGGR